MELRLSTKADAPGIAELMGVVFEQMKIPLAKEELLNRTITAFTSPDFHFEVAQTLVAVAQTQIVGIAFGYPGANESAVSRHWDQAFEGTDIRIHPDQETNSKEWYLEVLATAKAVRGRGIGSQLLTGATAMTKDANLSITGLNVDVDNPQAEKLYTREGFQRTGQINILGHPYYHMQRRI